MLRVKDLPSPIYDPNQWLILQSLFALLPLLVAHLKVIFNDSGCMDFIEVSLNALQALGGDEAPTDLACFFDYRMQHLLIDEFQDTSLLQYQFFSKLVSQWQNGDGKSLFVVGDPMQSIYRFRSAEVGLFLKAKKEGIGPVKLIPLQLKCNFRSTTTLLDWINEKGNGFFS